MPPIRGIERLNIRYKRITTQKDCMLSILSLISAADSYSAPAAIAPVAPAKYEAPAPPKHVAPVVADKPKYEEPVVPKIPELPHELPHVEKKYEAPVDTTTPATPATVAPDTGYQAEASASETQASSYGNDKYSSSGIISASVLGAVLLASI